jgi:hypothetical protein
VIKINSVGEDFDSGPIYEPPVDPVAGVSHDEEEED